MASTLAPIVMTYKAAGTIAKGQAVKVYTSDESQVVVSAATTDKHVGIALGAAVAGQFVEVAVGGGAKALAHGTITAGKLLTVNADGALEPVAAANDRIVAMAMKSAVAADLFEVIIHIGQATAVES